MPPPTTPKIYHIVHADRLPSIIAAGRLWCDAKFAQRKAPGTIIGMHHIKERRLYLPLKSHPDLHVGDCVPFYFCPRSVMLYLIYKMNYEGLDYRGGQGKIVHLEADLHETVAWADQNRRRWAFTLSNAGARYFEDRCDLAQLDEINWTAVQAKEWRYCKESKQAEFLVEKSFPWELVQRVGVHLQSIHGEARESMRTAEHQPKVEIIRGWYY